MSSGSESPPLRIEPSAYFAISDLVLDGLEVSLGHLADLLVQGHGLEPFLGLCGRGRVVLIGRRGPATGDRRDHGRRRNDQPTQGALKHRHGCLVSVRRDLGPVVAPADLMPDHAPRMARKRGEINLSVPFACSRPDQVCLRIRVVGFAGRE